jgi:lysophospholipase L1-like esterase
MKLLSPVIILFIFFIQGYAQDSISFKKNYPFIKLSKNKIENDSLSLNYFFKKLDSLEKKLIPKVVILQIGDSHLQADYFPGKTRVKLQQQFGNAGRGLVTPFRVGKTNEPDNYRSWSNKTWRAKRVVIEKDSLPIGLSGLSLYQNEPGTQLRIRIANQENLDYRFNKISVIQDTRKPYLPIAFCDSMSCRMARLEAKQNEYNQISSVDFSGLYSEITLIFDPADSLAQNASSLLYALIFENGDSGILYHTVGINGAEFRHYAKQENFIKQTAMVKPDLIIFSMGTNEAFSPAFKPEEFSNHIDSLVNAIKELNPNTSILFTTPGDAMRRVKYKNPRNKIAGKTIIEFATLHHYGYWNLFEIMGGYGSIQKWYVKKLTSKDKLHLNRRGYELQGLLLSEAIMNAYSSFKLR